MIELLDGPGAWLASRAGGVTAYVALTIEIAFGMFLSTGVADRWIARARSIELHRWLSRGALLLVIGHAAALLFDRVQPFDLVDLVVPFAAPYRTFAVGLGVVAMWLLWLVHVSFGLRQRLGQRLWRTLHYASFGVFGLATAHGALAGTDELRVLHLASGALVTLLIFVRMARATKSEPVSGKERA